MRKPPAFLLDVCARDGLTDAASGVLPAVVAGVDLYMPARRLPALEPIDHPGSHTAAQKGMA